MAQLPPDPFAMPGPVLFVPPLRIVAPPGVHAPFPPPFNPQNPFNGLHPGVFAPPRAPDVDHSAKNGRPKSSAVRDFPPGCGKNGHSAPGPSVPHSSPGRSKASSPQQQASQPQVGKQASQPQVGKQPAAGEHFGAASPSSAAPENRKRKRNASSAAEMKKPKRSAARPRGSAQGMATPSSVSAKRAITDTVRLYDAIRRNLVLEEETKGGKESKGSRPDLNAGCIINSKGLSVNRTGKVVGPVPGVDVGDQFYFRMEICCIGLHGPIQAGIEYLTAKESQWETPVAISIISSGGYDDRDDGEELIYTGQGGKSALDSKQNEDQKLERGNLAMEGSMKNQIPVRVIRGIKDAVSPSGKTYTYDGLYKVAQCWSEKGKSGFEEFKFRLQRLPGQPELGSALIKLSNQLKQKSVLRKGLRMADLSSGKEAVPVCVVNSVDNEHCPAPFEYSSTSVPLPSGMPQEFGSGPGCDCKGVCSASQMCSCFLKNQNAFAYLNNGVLVKERGLIYECGSNCQCSLSCRNRSTQKTQKYRMEVFKTEDRGWGLRSWDILPAGSFVCEYTGMLVQDGHWLPTKDYVLNLRRAKSNPRWGEVSKILESKVAQAAQDLPKPQLIIDSSRIGNMARFINHSCSPNLLVQCVLRDHEDARYPHIMLFAMDNIPPFRELTIDYGSELPMSEFQVQGKACLCKSTECRGRFYQ